jgi:membrane protein
MRIRTRKFWHTARLVFRDSVQRFSAADPIVYSAAIAFFTIFSMPPILLIVVRVAGALIGTDPVKEEVYGQVREKISPESAEQVSKILDEGQRLGDDPLTNTLSILLILFAATVVFNFIKQALNRIWGVKPKPRKGWLKFLIDRGISIALILVMGILVVASLLADSYIAFFEKEFSEELFGMTPWLAKLLNFLVSFGLMSLVFTLMFRYMPDILSPWKPMWVGGLITAALFTLGKFLIGRIIGSIDITLRYGAAGSLAAILLWVFYSSVIILLGAIFTKIYFLHSGYKIQANSQAVRVEVREVVRNDGRSNGDNPVS